eukprot:270806-Pleurochrysis_carterae.AAC.1
MHSCGGTCQLLSNNEMAMELANRRSSAFFMQRAASCQVATRNKRYGTYPIAEALNVRGVRST